MTSSSLNSTTTIYGYDGEGHRVTKTTGGVTTTYVYDAMGQLAAEYGPPTGISGTNYVSVDPLGSTRLVTDPSGNPARCYDYLPFGEELASGTDGRASSCFTSTAALLTQGFTGKERDSESGMDHYDFRYMSAAQGRFLSVDPSYESEILEYPQTWNRYSYVYNSPLRFTDPDGRCPNCFAAAVGAVIGGVLEAGIDVGTQLYNNGGNLRDVSLAEAGASFAGGFVTGGLAGLTLGGSLIADVAVGGVASVAGGVVNRAVLQEATGDYTVDPFSGNEMAADFASGLIGGAVGNRVAHRAAELLHAPEVGPYPRKGRGFQRRLAEYNVRVKAQQRVELKAFAVGTAVSTPIAHEFDSWFKSSWFNPILPSWQSFLTFGCQCIEAVESTVHY